MDMPLFSTSPSFAVLMAATAASISSWEADALFSASCPSASALFSASEEVLSYLLKSIAPTSEIREDNAVLSSCSVCAGSGNTVSAAPGVASAAGCSAGALPSSAEV